MWIISNLRPGEVWSRRVAGGFGVLRQKKRHSSGDHHPRRHHTDAAVHRRVRLLLQVGRRRRLEPAQNHSLSFFPRVIHVFLGFFSQEEESAGGAGVREGETPAGEPGGKRSGSLQEGVHR